MSVVSMELAPSVHVFSGIWLVALPRPSYFFSVFVETLHKFRHGYVKVVRVEFRRESGVGSPVLVPVIRVTYLTGVVPPLGIGLVSSVASKI